MSKCGVIKTGDLKHRITIMTKTTQRKSGGGLTELWAEDFSLWAKIKPKRWNPLIQADDRGQVVSYDIYVRYRTDITTKQRIKYGSRYLFIDSFHDLDETGNYLLIVASEQQTANTEN